MVIQPCWILCTPRTGSSYLCELLNNTGLFPPYIHQGLKEVKGPIQKGLAFNEWLRLFNNGIAFMANPPPYCKAIYHQYLEVMGAIPESNRYRPGFYFDYYKLNSYNWITSKYNDQFLSSLLPNIKFILLRRKNLFAHAISLYVARQTKRYHIYDENALKDHLSSKVVMDESLLILCWQDANTYAKLWDQFLSQPALELDYDGLIHKTERTLRQVSEFLGVQIDISQILERTNNTNKRIYKMTHPDAQFYEKELRKMIIKIL